MQNAIKICNLSLLRSCSNDKMGDDDAVDSPCSGVEEAILHWSGKNTNRNVGLGACLPGKFMP